MRNRSLTWALLAILLAAVLLYYIFSNPSTPAPVQQQVIETKPTASGKLFFTARTGNDFLPNTYLLDLVTGVMDSSKSMTDSKVIHPTIINDSQAVFVGTNKEMMNEAFSGNAGFGKAFQVFVAPFSGKIDSLDLKNATQVTSIDGTDKRNPQISADMKYVLTMVKDEGADLMATSTEDITKFPFSVYLTSLDDKKTSKVATGAFPEWVNANSFLYVTSDGLHLYNVLSGKDTVAFQAELKNNTKIDVSNDGKLVALVVPDAQKVFILNYDSIQGTLSHKGDIDVLAYWAVFSPAGDQVLVQYQDQKQTSPEILVYNINNLKEPFLRKVLEGFNNDSLFINDWIK